MVSALCPRQKRINVGIIHSNSSFNSQSAIELTDEQRKEYEDMFYLFDKNGDGRISTAELGEVMSSLGQMVTEAELMDMVKCVDKDGNGTIELEEFLNMMANKVDISPEELHQAFNAFDKDGNGLISREELRSLSTSIGEEITEAEIDEMIKKADLNGDGQISRQGHPSIMLQYAFIIL